MPQHKDQKRISEEFLPFLEGRVLDEDPVAVRDCVVLNRLMLQGPDPLFLMEVCPEQIEALCDVLEVPVSQGKSAIEKAHWQGPGSLLFGKGLSVDAGNDFVNFPNEWRVEALWLLLASISNCTEDNYDDSVSVIERLRRQAKAIYDLAQMTTGRSLPGLMFMALESLKTFVASTTFTIDEYGIPHATQDHAFYVLYKAGYKCAAVHTDGGLVFYGTTPDTTLAEQGVTVHKEISAQFGIVFPESKTTP